MKRSGFPKLSYEEVLQRQTAKPRGVRAPLRCHKPMKKRGGKPETGSIKDLERQLDELVRKVLREDEQVCFTDGKPGTAENPLQVSHMFGRAQRPTRFDVHPDGNNHLMHASCNSRHNDDKSIYRNEYIRRFGEEAFEDLERRAHQPDTWSWVELSKMILHREEMLK